MAKRSLFFWGFFPLVLWAQPRVEFPEDQFDFGLVPQGSTLTHTFSLRNVGNKPLQIESVQTSCGCTVATPTGRWVQPGEVAEIQVNFDSRRKKGNVASRIQVRTNDFDSPLSVLTLKGTVGPVDSSTSSTRNEVNHDKKK